MKKIFLSLTIALAGVVMISNTAKAQLADGSFAPDWTLTDVDGNTWNLYDLLDQGKSVFIDVFAVWCGPCWSYHNTGNLDALYETYGPDGTDEVMVFQIEGDGASTMDELNGIGAGTQGDWLAGTPYPTIMLTNGTPEFNFMFDYSIAYFPTIYRICQNRIVDEVGQVSTAVLYGSTADCASASVSVDPSILSYDGPVSGCSNVELTVTIQNMGFDPLTACTIKAFSDGTELLSFDWSGDLSTYQVDQVSIGTIELPSPTSDIDIEITSADDNADNNTISTTISYEDNVTQVIHLELKTDSYPTETTWEVVDESTGDVLFDGGPYTNGEKNEVVFDEDMTLPASGCYSFTCYDSYGDGLTGSGYYKLYDASGSLISSGFENIGLEKGVALKVTVPNAIENNDLINNISLYPNPADAMFNLSVNVANTADVTLTVVDIFGKSVATITSGTLSAGSHTFNVNTADFASGMYFVKVSGADLNQGVKFNVMH